MAGKRHHFIPQFLQRGFASQRIARINKADDYNAWVFRKTGDPFNTNIKNIALEGQFYNHEGDTFVDDIITVAEGPLALFVTELRNANDRMVVDSRHAASLLTHISIRTRHLRIGLKDVGESLVGRVLSAFSDAKSLEKAYLAYVRANPQFLGEAIKEQLDEMLSRVNVPESVRSQLSEFLFPAALEATTTGDIGEAVGMMAQSIAIASENFQRDSAKLDAIAKNGHLRALRRSLAPPKKLELLSNLNFHVRKFADRNLILGDSGVVFAVGSNRAMAPFFDGIDPVRAAILPLDLETCLVGISKDSEGIFDTSESVRQHVAACSLEYFLASTKSDENLSLVSHIGSNARLLTDDEVEGVITEIGLGNTDL